MATIAVPKKKAVVVIAVVIVILVVVDVIFEVLLLFLLLLFSIWHTTATATLDPQFPLDPRIQMLWTSSCAGSSIPQRGYCGALDAHLSTSA